jgi:hypothetical protein
VTDPSTSMPPLQVVDLDDDTLADLFADVGALGDDVEIVIKRGAGHVAPEEEISLCAAMQLLKGRRVHGVQLRYRYRDASFWDTLMPTSAGVRLVRIQHEPGGDDPQSAQR